MKDPIGRSINYLRISVTDLCNYRCVYCMPLDGVGVVEHSNIMRFEEIIKVVQAAAAFGVTKIRLTGGEPLVRHGIVDLVRMIRQVDGIEEITITTNGFLLGKYAKDLKEAGLTRVNISLDTLNPDLFQKITRKGDITTIWKGIEEAEKYNLTPIKINMVMLEGINDHEIPDFMDLSMNHDWHIRFIELMPVKNQISWGESFPDPSECYVSTGTILNRYANKGLEPVDQVRQSGPAKLYRIPAAKGLIGFISPLDDEHFCNRCNRLRLTADGNLRPCLMNDLEIPLLSAIREGKDIKPLVAKAIGLKPAHHELLQNQSPESRTMMQIGG